MQHQSCPISHSSSRYACPPFNLRPKTPVFAFNIGFYDPDPNEIDPLDPSCLPNDIDTKANAPGEFVFLTQSPAIVLPSFERQRYSRAPNSSTQTPLLSGYTETLSTPGFTPSPALLWTPPSPHMHDFGHSHPLRDKRAYELITQVDHSTEPFFQNASPLTCTGRFIRKIKTTQIPYLRPINSPPSVELSKRIPHLLAPRPRPSGLTLQGTTRSSSRGHRPCYLHWSILAGKQYPQGNYSTHLVRALSCSLLRH